MTALIPTIYITNNYLKIREFFLNGRYPNLQNLKDDESSLLITPETNRYIESFEVSFNSEKSEKDILVLQVVDTDGKFEEKLIGFNLNTAKKKVLDKYSETRNQALITNSKLNINAFQTTIANFAVRQSTIYVAFGTGNDFKDWSDPKVFRLVNAKVDISNNGLRRYTLEFAPSIYSIFRPKLLFNLELPNPESEFLFTKSIENVVGRYATDKKNDKETFSEILYHLIKDYIMSITGIPRGNIIGILPDVGVSVSQYGEGIDPNKGEYSLTQKEMGAAGVTFASSRSIPVNWTNNLKAPVGRSQLSPLSAEQEALAKLPETWFYYIEATPLDKTELNPKFPDFYQPLNKINLYIKSKIKTVDNLVLMEENDCKILNFFYQKKLIEDPTQKCIIFGMDRMIHSWLYRDLAPSEETASIDQILNSITNTGTSPEPHLMKPSSTQAIPADPNADYKEYPILTNKTYAKDFLEYISRFRTNSNFSENLELDELAVDAKSKQFYDSFKSETSKLFKLLTIPIFTNNLKNSNVLDIQLLNNENYLAGLNIAVRDNFSRFFLSNINKNLDLLKLGISDLESVRQKTEEVLNDVFNDPQVLNLLQDAATEFLKLRYPELANTGISWPLTVTVFERYELFKKIVLEQLISTFSQKDVPQVVGTIIGYPYYPTNRFKDYFSKNREFFIKLISNPKIQKIFTGYDDLIIKNKGNIDLDAVFISYAKIELGYQAFDLPGLIRLGQKAVRSGVNDPFDPEGSWATEEPTQELAKNRAKLATLYQYSLIISSLFKKQPNDRGGVNFVPRVFGVGEDEIMADLFDALNKFSWKVSIKTLPFFYLSNQRLMAFKPCFLFSKKLNVVGDSKQNELDFFSGMYNIISFKHVINTKEAYSEFILIKRAQNANI